MGFGDLQSLVMAREFLVMEFGVMYRLMIFVVI
jgi:hypothetical protein